MKFRKKSVVIDAVKFEGDLTLWPKEFRDVLKYRFDKSEDREKMIFYIQTLEGDMQAKMGDYIIKGIKGEFYPCKPDIFEATYEKVETVGDDEC